MKILEACYISSSFRGSFLNSIIELTESLEKEGNSVDFLFPVAARNTEWCKYLEKKHTIFYVNVKHLKDVKAYLKILFILFKKNYTIIHSHYEMYDFPLTIANKLFNKKTKIIWHCHDATIDYEHINNEIINFNKKYYLTLKPTKLIVINKYFKEFLLNIGCDAKQIILVENGIYLKDLYKLNNNKCDKFTFSTMGWDVNIKGVDFIINACELLAKEGYTFKLLINGNDTTVQQLNQYFNTENWPTYIEFQYPQNNRMDFFNKTNVFIQASRFETFSFSVCEALYVGLPVICNDIDGLQWAKEFQNTKFFNKNDYLDLYKKMKECLELTPLQYNSNTQKEIEEKYSTDTWCDKIKDIYYTINYREEN